MLDTTSLHASMRDLGLEPVICRRVLIVDDEPALVETLEGLLEDHFDVITASGGRDALRQLEAGDIVDVIVTDQRMPGMLGVDFLEEASKRLPDTIRMVVTAYADVDPIIDAINRGAAYRFLSKPYNADELRAAITEGMQLKAARTSLAQLMAALETRRNDIETALDELRAAQDQLVAAERLTTLGKMTAGIAHDIRNQLAGMRVMLSLLQGSGAESVLREPVKRAVASLDHLSKLVTEAQEFAKADSGALQRLRVDPRELIADTLVLWRAENTAATEVEVELDESLTWLTVDPLRVTQGLLVLLRNAARANRDDATVALRVARSGAARHGVTLSVIDRGDGMDADTLARAPEPFFSAFDPPSLGLGLEVARLVAASHGGSLEITSAQGLGTTASLLLADADGGTHA
jgi:signal transduction histidine kinase